MKSLVQCLVSLLLLLVRCLAVLLLNLSACHACVSAAPSLLPYGSLMLSHSQGAGTDPGLTDFLSMALLSFSSTAPIERFKFTATTSSVVLRVRSTAREGGGAQGPMRQCLCQGFPLFVAKGLKSGPVDPGKL